MEPIKNTNADNNTEAQQTMDEHLEKIVQDFNEFREKMSGKNSNEPMKLEDLVDLYIDNGCENYSHAEPQANHDQFTTQQHVGPIDSESQENFQTYEEENVNLNFDFGPDSDGVTYIRYGDLNYEGAAGEFIGSIFGGEVNFWWRWVGGTARRERTKRKYTRGLRRTRRLLVV
ncbi:RNA polymerase sigma factor RpoS [Striga asiatica]|uniref:RNA polymerase sigma factor RpoS n=1 Tax=Striga asiatica TaxID=4170 RepID=A0A5A7PM45_STRAF|nr:RNA polymerase sigma factor RpoS [Striga asiatica]